MAERALVLHGKNFELVSLFFVFMVRSLSVTGAPAHVLLMHRCFDFSFDFYYMTCMA